MREIVGFVREQSSITFWQRCSAVRTAPHSDSVVWLHVTTSRAAIAAGKSGATATAKHVSKAAPHAISPKRNAVASGKCRNSIRVAFRQ